MALATLRGWVRMDSVFFPFVLQANLCSWAGVAQKTEQDSLVWAGGLFKAEWNHLVLRVCSQCQAPESHPPEPHKSCHFRQLKWFYNALHMPHKPWRPCRELGESFGCLCYLMLMFLLSSSELKRIRGTWCRTIFAANTKPHQTCDETSPVDTFPALLWLHPATTPYSPYWCTLEPSSRKVVWTLMARRILGLTRLSAVLSWRLGLTHAKLEESTSCIPSC